MKIDLRKIFCRRKIVEAMILSRITMAEAGSGSTASFQDNVTCLTVHDVIILSDDCPGKESGLLSVFQVPGDQNNVDRFELCVMVGAESVFAGTITTESLPSQLQSQSTDNQLIKLLTTREDVSGSIETSYRIVAKDPLSLSISAKERTQTGLVRELWATTLRRLEQQSSIIDLTRRLAAACRLDKERVAQLKVQVSETQQCRDLWKDTASKLEGKWETEKTTLFRNFHTLYSERQTLLSELTQKVENLETENAKLHAELAEKDVALATSKKAPRHRKQDDLDIQLPDDQDRLHYEDDFVAQMASIPPRETRPAVKRKRARPRTNNVGATGGNEAASQASSDKNPPKKNGKKQETGNEDDKGEPEQELARDKEDSFAEEMRRKIHSQLGLR